MDSVGNNVTNRKNPRATAGVLSSLTFAWTYDLFRRGFQRELQISDLCEPLPEHSSHLLGNKLEEYWNKELEAYKKCHTRKPSLIRVILKVYGAKIFFYTACGFFSQFLFKLGQPLCFNQLIQYFTPDSTVTYSEAKMYAAGVVLCIGMHVLTISPILFATAHLGMKIRVATSSLIYRKSLRLSKESTSRIGAGRVVNILSNDASRFNNAIVFLPDAIIAPVIAIVVTYVIWWEAGWPALIGVAVLLIFVPLQSVLAKKTALLRYRTAAKADYRIRLMSEIATGIQVIKMYAWEKSFANLVALARRNEVAVIRKKGYYIGILNSANAFANKLALLSCLLAFTYYGYAIKANVVYVLVLCYAMVESNLIMYFPVAISYAAESYVSIRRMEEFLMSDEATDVLTPSFATSVNDGHINTTDLCARWSKEGENTLDRVNVRIEPGSLVAVVGPVGSGKSSFLQLILRELPVISGVVDVGGTVSYAAQEPWLFGGTVCQNILFGLPMEKEKYQEVVRVCALEADFEQLPHGDRTTIGDRGASLSGGQKARVNLARAVYRDADIYLLDDPLSAVDSHVSKHLFEECIRGYLAGKTVVLVTHHVDRLNNLGHVIKLDGGKVTAQGSFQELWETGVDISRDEPASLHHEDQEQGIDEKEMNDGSTKSDVQKGVEIRSKGKIGASVYLAYLKAAKSSALVLCAVATYVLVITATSGSDYWLSFWVNNEEYVFLTTDIYIPYVGELNTRVCMYVYGILISIVIISAVLRTILSCVLCMRASTNLHNSLFTSISHATMNFFNNTPSGQILNRFSLDIGIIDEELPKALTDAVRTGFQVFGALVIIFTVNWYLTGPFAVMLFVLYNLRQYYMATARSVKRIESVARSPIYTHVNASMQGLTTIRALHAQIRLQQEFDRKMDVHSSAWYYILGANRAFAYYLDISCCLFIAAVTFSFLLLNNNYQGGEVGLAITQSMSLTFLFQWCIRQSAEVENQMTSVERVCEYAKVDSENEHMVTAPGTKLGEWPARGAVQFSDVSLYYDPTGSAVLKNISFEIRPGEKIGVVGRTGAGKSSLIAALFRLQKVEGKIIIDGIDTSSIGLNDLRSKLAIIPQDPVLFSGTMRFNLDPFEEFKDEELWNVLEEVELKYIVRDCPGGLLTHVSEGGVNLSVGQRQLVCLARAILRNSKVLILDEATANVDAKTDDFIRAAIRKRFGHCTVITIAHRLHTIMDSDRVLVMDQGAVAQFGPPEDLMLDSKGKFAQLAGSGGARPSVIGDQVEKKASGDLC